MIATHTPLRTLITRLKRAGRPCTLLGVGPVSHVVVRAALEACKRHDCPAIFIASRNQVDLRSLGHGYLMGGMDQAAFVALLHETSRTIGFDGPLYVCRDHGGPWQRNVELNGKYPVDRAMAIARESFRADIEAGFNYLHIDPTKCPFPSSRAELCARTVEILEYCEAVRRARGNGAIDYEVGSEDIQGGLTSRQDFEAFLRDLTAALDDAGLPQPTCVVGQTGTLCRMDRNVGRFDWKRTEELAGLAMACGVGFKEHNGDYLSAASCRIHPTIGVTGMNVAPEFGLVETDALLALTELEAKLVREGWLAAGAASNLRPLLLARTFTNSPWPKWMSDEVSQLPREQVERDSAVRLLIARVCGHYVFDLPEFVAARRRLYAHVERFDLVDDADRFVVERVRSAIEFYIRHFRLEGINALV
ncbi:MAG: class II D-tagatose-bisphosphate aldolase, non-catalytic subunit [Kiritimatiellae bacterium]|nr:class II D-tagatose-bisphosphate aldolase, non-catalytic subunit [Kiritimatiellia bacterium]